MDDKRHMRRIAALSPFLLALAACSEESAPPSGPQPKSEQVECAIGGGAPFEPVCTLERNMGPDGLTLTIRSPSGSFRRLLVTKDGRGVVSADGAERAAVTPIAGNQIEVAIAGDRYRLPATVRP
jgi:hypothetical protein